RIADDHALDLGAARAVAAHVHVEPVAAEHQLGELLGLLARPHVADGDVPERLGPAGADEDVGAVAGGPLDADVAGQVEHLGGLDPARAGVGEDVHGEVGEPGRPVEGDLPTAGRRHLGRRVGLPVVLLIGGEGRGDHHLVAGTPAGGGVGQGQRAGAGGDRAAGAGPGPPRAQRAGGSVRASVPGLAGTPPPSRVQGRRGVPTRSRAPAPITHRPTSEETGSMPPPTIRDSATPSKTSSWSTAAEAGRITSRPSTTTLPVLARVWLADGSKISSPPGLTVTPATVASVSSRIRRLTTATSPVPGTPPLGQLSGSLQGFAPAPFTWGRLATVVSGGRLWSWPALVTGAAAGGWSPLFARPG